MSHIKGMPEFSDDMGTFSIPQYQQSRGRKFSYGCFAIAWIASIVLGILAYKNTFGKIPDNMGGPSAGLGMGIGLPPAIALIIKGMCHVCKRPDATGLPGGIPEEAMRSFEDSEQ